MKVENKNVNSNNNYIEIIKFNIILRLKRCAWGKECWMKHEDGDEHCEKYEDIREFWGPFNSGVGVMKRCGVQL